MKVLVVEDDRKVAGFIEQGLKEEGWTVDVAPDGDEATMLAHVYQYDVILLDVNMPGMTGPELHRHLVKEGYEIPTILVTAYPDDAVRARALKDGVLCYLPKPVDDHHMEECIRFALAADEAR